MVRASAADITLAGNGVLLCALPGLRCIHKDLDVAPVTRDQGGSSAGGSA